MNKLIDVKIFNNGKFLNKIAKKRPLRLMPSGRQGVVYKKRVYEVLKGNKINISNSSYDKDECPLINFNKTKRKFEIQDWHIDIGFYNYLLINGSEELCDRALAFLDENDISWLRSDKSFKKAKNGTQYDWYIRLDDDADINELRKILYHPSTKNHKTVLKPNIEIQAKEKKIDELEAKNIALKRSLQEKENDSEFVDMIIDDNYRYKEMIKKLEDQLRNNDEDKKLPMDKRTGKKKDLINKIASMVEHFLPNLKFHDRSYNNLVDMQNIDPLIKKMSRINDSTISTMIKEMKLKKVRGSNNCWELSKISDGLKGASTRLYLIPSSKNYKKTIVLLGNKQSQTKDIDSLMKIENSYN